MRRKMRRAMDNEEEERKMSGCTLSPPQLDTHMDYY
jgi:hypothetical protein